MNKLTRRAALAIIPVAALPSVGPAIAASSDSSLAEIERLIAAHNTAKAADKENWCLAADIDEAAMPFPFERVQVARLLGGRDDDGNDTWRPIYAYSDEDIDAEYSSHIAARLSMCGANEAAKAKVRAHVEEAKDRKKAELAAARAERKRAEDECGYTAAIEAARASADVVRAIEAQIIAIEPGSLASAARMAAWVVEAFDDDDSYLGQNDEEPLIAALTAIGKASS